MEEAVENLNAILAQRLRWAEGEMQRFFDYGDQLWAWKNKKANAFYGKI